MLERNNPKRLIIALEPEAAAVYVQKDTQADFEHYMIIDCGGGTVDICVHELVKSTTSQGKHAVRETTLPSGGAWGGIYVDQKFVEFLEQIFSKECITTIKNNCIQEWYELLSKFENTKRHFKSDVPIDLYHEAPEQSSEIEEIMLPHQMIVDIEKYHEGISMREIVDKHVKTHCPQTNNPIAFKRGKLRVPKSQMLSFFTPAIKEILTHIGNLLENDQGCAGVKALYVVGGFAECDVLQKSIKHNFGNSYKVVIPLGPQTAIVKGAVHYGMQPKIISERVSRLTYGVAHAEEFDPDEHDARYKLVHNGMILCGHLFHKFVEKGQTITPANSVHRLDLDLADENQTEIYVKLYATKKINVKYALEDGVEKVAEVHHNIPHPEKGKNRKLKVTLDFSDTEVYLIVSDSESSEISYRVVDFIFKQY